MFSSCALHVTRVCSLAAVLRPSAAAATGSAAFGRAGAFGARWHLHWHAIVSSRAVQSRASACSQALDATCVSRKRHQVHGDASFCADVLEVWFVTRGSYSGISRDFSRAVSEPANWARLPLRLAPDDNVRVATETVGGRKIAHNLHRLRTPCRTPTVRLNLDLDEPLSALLPTL
jgi:hypothetical protein